MTNLAKRGSLGIRELEPSFQLGLQDAVFGRQIFVPRQHLLIHRARDAARTRAQFINGPLTPPPSRSLNVPDWPPEPLYWRWITDRVLDCCFSFLTTRDTAAKAPLGRRQPQCALVVPKEIDREFLPFPYFAHDGTRGRLVLTLVLACSLSVLDALRLGQLQNDFVSAGQPRHNIRKRLSLA